MRITGSAPIVDTVDPAEAALSTLIAAIEEAQDRLTADVQPVDYVESVHLVSIGGFRGLTVVVRAAEGIFTRGDFDAAFAEMGKALGLTLPVLVEQAR